MFESWPEVTTVAMLACVLLCVPVIGVYLYIKTFSSEGGRRARRDTMPANFAPLTEPDPAAAPAGEEKRREAA